MVRTIKKDKTAGEKLKLICVECRIPQNHVVLTSMEDCIDESNFESQKSYQIVQCLNCEALCFRSEYDDSQSHAYDMETGEDFHWTEVDIFPHRTAGRFKIKDSFLLPPIVRKAYDELVDAMNAGQTILAGLGIRVVLESICVDLKAEGDNLFKKINDLLVKGAITKSDVLILHKLRSLGNTAAHEAKPSSTEQLDLAMNVLEHLLLGTYLHPRLADNVFKT
ncbi:uncharacterized protein DUF4145 [Pseudomonas baetica]|uniref:Uncharacterized protein DUF4145 n=1 Tax=Pseudomonas baetica TaxID=674054 RepID=A0ABX4Q6Z2_9PSED|nr:DUF4145 domain-containing protein [Pseudomonas baetica]PKA72562.1 uncharacterized protein DUF4145 [Pseudomonas baetica]PTC16994.1 hypothetical protein C0J26_23935 [Pseudomonas baetica]